jgi:hypothetical protein
MEGVLSVPLAIRLRDAGLRWKPAPGDRFAIPDRDLDDEVFVLSNMVIAVYELPDGPVIGFNGTTEWAMDDVEQSEAIWLPREDQLRELLGGTFHMLERSQLKFRVEITAGGRRLSVEGGTAEEAYGAALLELIRLGVD